MNLLGKTAWLGAAVTLIVMLQTATVYAQGDDPLMKHPDVFIVFDISGSMNSCAIGVPCERTRITAAQEVLTGTSFSAWLTPTGACPADQLDDGILDSYANLMRFGLGAFDDTCDRTGTAANDYGDDTGVSQGRGLRERAAAMGGLVDVVDPDHPEDMASHTQVVQDAICQLTSGWCTPLAASLYDARYYFQNYEKELKDSSGKLYTDPMGIHAGDCRPRFVLFMTDGLEFPPCDSCPEDATGDICPEAHTGNYAGDCSWYGNEAMQAKYLADQGIPVFVVGYGNMDAATRMRMHRIARAGLGEDMSKWNAAEDPFDAIPEAFIADNPIMLRLVFTTILDAILAGSTSRTASATAPASVNFDKSYEFSSSFEIGLFGPTWKGYIARAELGPDLDNDGNPDLIETIWFGGKKPPSAPASPIVPLGDVSGNRNLFTIIKDPRSQTFLHPTYALPRYPGAAVAEDGLFPFDPAVPFTPDNSMMCLKDPEGMGHDALETYIKRYMEGTPGFTDVAAVRIAIGKQLGDIFHSNPVIVPPPTALTPDYKFEAYFQTYKNRHTMLYVGANDGFLHAFVAEDNIDDGTDETGTELWGFMPYNLLAKVEKMRWGAHQFFVDGSPVVKDVYMPNREMPDPGNLGNCLTDASGNCIMGTYRTILIGGERGGGPTYYALDVTEPDRPGYMWEYRTSVGPMADYEPVQCDATSLQSWAEPVIGKVWLKEAGSDTYLTKSVAVMPGGYIPSMSLQNITSCTKLVESLTSTASLHVVDIETGKLLRKFSFAGSGLGAMEAQMEAYHALLDDAIANNKDNNWQDKFEYNWDNVADANFDSGDFNGFMCDENRDDVRLEHSVPPSLSDATMAGTKCEITENSGNIKYQINCCHKDAGTCKPQGINPCHYTRTEYTNGAIETLIKTSGCPDVPVQERGNFQLKLGSQFRLQTVAATPAAYNTTWGKYISRIFVATSAGQIFRVNMANAQYDESKPEGQMIEPYDLDASKDWKQDPDNGPWFDPADLAPVPDCAGNTIMVAPSLALDHSRDLILYYGTGEIDSLDFNPNQHECIFAVREIRGFDGDDYFGPIQNAKGVLVSMKNDLEPSERLFGQPLVLSSQIYFATFTPDDDECGLGTATVYVTKFDNFADEQFKKKLKKHPPPPPIKPRWGPEKLQMVMQKGIEVMELPIPEPRTTSQVVNWGKVL